MANGSDFYCECLPGFEGGRCQVDTDECKDVVCAANKICVDLVNSFECRCPRGFAGENCLVEINECDSSPCFNGATCVDLTVRKSTFSSRHSFGLDCCRMDTSASAQLVGLDLIVKRMWMSAC